MEESLFWADQKAADIIQRSSFHFLDKPVEKRDLYVVKSSASLSGVLHIGRLSDTIRADSVVTALEDAGVDARMIWVAEDMDPLRKIPRGVPKEYEDYLGKPVTDVPDPQGCHQSYAEHHQEEYLDVIHKFVSNEMDIFSMREQYKKGFFSSYIRSILQKVDEVKEILGKYRDSELSKTWSPWKPICSKCGKIITPRIIELRGTKVRYECRDYDFEKTTARGCGYIGEAEATSDEGKLLWKGEWASEWARWNVACEGGGKEYEVPTSAWWVNGEIVERILDYPMPEPFFYEHLMIDGEKMSASVGNVVYPSQWLQVAPPELLRFLYNKKLMKTRSFTWRGLPRLYSDYDRHADVYYGITVPSNERERAHMSRLYEISQLGDIPDKRPAMVDFSFASLIAQIYDPETQIQEALETLQRSGIIGEELSGEDVEFIRRRLQFGLRWVESYVPDQALTLAEVPDRDFVSQLSENEISALERINSCIRSSPGPGEIQSTIFSEAKNHGVKPGRMFRILYRLVLKKKSGPRFGPLVSALGNEAVSDILQRAIEVAR